MLHCAWCQQVLTVSCGAGCLLCRIPAAEFLSNVDEHLETTKTNHEQALAQQQVRAKPC